MQQTLMSLNEDIAHYVKKVEEQHPLDYSKVSGMIIHFISERLDKVKDVILSKDGLAPEEEIFFFKHIKARLLAHIYYYAQIQRIEIKKPCSSREKVKKYYLKKLFKVKKKLKRNAFFYNYYKSGRNHLDQQLFLGLNPEMIFKEGSFLPYYDKNSRKPAVHHFAKIEALDKIRNYLKAKIKEFDEAPTIKQKPLTWTTSKVELIELIYALHAAGVFNHGKAEIKEIAEYCQENFNIQLGQYNRIFFDIRTRKMNKTKFMDHLKEVLHKKILETENQLFYD